MRKTRNLLDGPHALRRWLHAKKLSGAWLSRELGYSETNRSSISRYLTGERKLPLEQLVRISELTGIGVDVLAWPEQWFTGHLRAGR